MIKVVHKRTYFLLAYGLVVSWKYILTTHMRPRIEYKLQSNVSLMMKPECRDVLSGVPVELFISCLASHIIKAKDSLFKKHVFCSIWVNKREANHFYAIQFSIPNEFMKSLKTASSDLCVSLVFRSWSLLIRCKRVFREFKKRTGFRFQI